MQAASVGIASEASPGTVRAACSGEQCPTKAPGCEEVFGGSAWSQGLVGAQGLSWLAARGLWSSFPTVPPVEMGPWMTEASGTRVQPQKGQPPLLCRGGSLPPMPGPVFHFLQMLAGLADPGLCFLPSGWFPPNPRATTPGHGPGESWPGPLASGGRFFSLLQAGGLVCRR